MSAHLVEHLELSITAPDEAPPWRTALMRRLGRVELPRIIEGCFAAVTTGDPLIRIERLHLDLGEIDEADLPQSLIAAFATAFSEAIGEERLLVHKANHEWASTEEDRRVEPLMDALKTFLSTGIYRPTRLALSPDEALSMILDEAPQRLEATLSPLLADAIVRLRLGRQVDQTTLKRALMVLGLASDCGLSSDQDHAMDVLALPTSALVHDHRPSGGRDRTIGDPVDDERSASPARSAVAILSDRLIADRDVALSEGLGETVDLDASLVVVARGCDLDARAEFGAFHAFTTAIRVDPAEAVAALRRASMRTIIVRRLVAFLPPRDVATLAFALSRGRASAQRGHADVSRTLISSEDWERYLHRLIESKDGLRASGRITTAAQAGARRHRASFESSVALDCAVENGSAPIAGRLIPTGDKTDQYRRHRLRRRRAARRIREVMQATDSAVILAEALAATVPAADLPRVIVASSHRQASVVATLLDIVADDPRLATPTMTAVLEELIDGSGATRSSAATLRAIAVRQARVSGIDPKAYIDRLRSTITDPAMGRILDRANTRARSHGQHGRDITAARSLRAGVPARSRNAAYALKRCTASLTDQTFRSVLREIAGPRAKALDRFIERSHPETVGANADRDMLLSIALTARNAREPIVDISRRLSADARREPIISGRRPVRTKGGDTRTASAVDCWLDATTPSERKKAIETCFGRNAPRVTSLIEASAGPLARPTIEAIVVAAMNRPRPWSRLSTAIVTEAARRAGLPPAIYSRAIANNSRTEGWRGAYVPIAGHDPLYDADASPPKNEPSLSAQTRTPSAKRDFDRDILDALSQAIDIKGSASPALSRALRAYRPRSLLQGRLQAQAPERRQALVRLLAADHVEIVTAWLDASRRVPDIASHTWSAILTVLLEAPPRTRRSVIDNIVREAAKLCGLTGADYAAIVRAEDRSGRLAAVRSTSTAPAAIIYEPVWALPIKTRPPAVADSSCASARHGETGLFDREGPAPAFERWRRSLLRDQPHFGGISSSASDGLIDATGSAMRQRLLDAMRSRPADLGLALSTYRPRALLVRSLVAGLPRGVGYDLIGLLARRDAPMITAWLEAADLTPALGPSTWTAAFQVLLDIRSCRQGAALWRLIGIAAKLSGLPDARYREHILDHDRSGHLAAWMALAESKVVRKLKTSGRKRRQQRKASALQLGDAGLVGEVGATLTLLGALNNAPVNAVSRATTIGRLSSLWRRDPDAFIAALRKGSPRSMMIRAVIDALSGEILRAIVSRLAGRHFGQVLVFVDRFTSLADLATQGWEAVLLVLLRYDGGLRTSRRLVDAIAAEAARRSQLSAEDYAMRIGYRPARGSARKGQPPDQDTRLHQIDGGAQATAIMPPDVAPQALSMKQAARLARRRASVDLFLALLPDNSRSQVDPTPPSAKAIERALSARSARPIAMALLGSAHRTGPVTDWFARLSPIQIERLLRPLSRGVRPLVTTLIGAASRAQADEGLDRDPDAVVIALECRLDLATKTVSPRAFTAAFVQALADKTDRRPADIVTMLRKQVTIDGSAARMLAGLRLAYRVAPDQLRRRGAFRPRSKTMTKQELNFLFEKRMARRSASADLHRLVAHIADGSRRGRRRSVYAAATTLTLPSRDHALDPQQTLRHFIWCGSIPSSAGIGESDKIRDLCRSVIVEQCRSPSTPWTIGLAARLRSRGDDGLVDPDQPVSALGMPAFVAALAVDSEVVFRRKVPAMRARLAAMLDKAAERVSLANALEGDSSTVRKRVVMLLANHADIHRSISLLIRDASRRHACDLFFHVLKEDTVPWWHPSQSSSREILTRQIVTQSRAIARLLETGDTAFASAELLIDRIGLDAIRPLIRALARRNDSLIQAMAAAMSSVLPSAEARWIIALDTLLAAKAPLEPSMLVTSFATRMSEQAGCSVDAIMTKLVEGLKTSAGRQAVDEARSAVLLEAGKRSGFLGRPFEVGDGSSPVRVMHHRLRYGADATAIDTAVREALAADPSVARDLAMSAIAHPIARARVAALPKQTLVTVLAALCDAPVRTLRPLLEGLALHPPSVDAVLAAIAAGRTDVGALAELVRSAMPRPIPIGAPARDQPRTRRPAGREAAAPIRVENAGLVIVASFLPRLFSGLGLFATDGSLPPEDAQRAVHLLQYLVAGETDALEHRLVLNKLLCGLDVAVPLIASIAMDERETEMADSMLQGVMQNWPPLKNTSIAGLRETFLQREGFLRETPEAWVLAVTPGPLDMLLDQLRWPISIVRLRWMTKLLKVEWR